MTAADGMSCLTDAMHAQGRKAPTPCKPTTHTTARSQHAGHPRMSSASALTTSQMHNLPPRLRCNATWPLPPEDVSQRHAPRGCRPPEQLQTLLCAYDSSIMHRNERALHVGLEASRLLQLDDQVKDLELRQNGLISPQHSGGSRCSAGEHHGEHDACAGRPRKPLRLHSRTAKGTLANAAINAAAVVTASAILPRWRNNSTATQRPACGSRAA